MDEEILEQLRERYTSGNLIVFAGAGVSAAAGMPTWKQLAEKLRDRARRRSADPGVIDEIQQYISSNQLINALSAARLALGPQDFNWTVDKELDDTGRDVPELARAIAALKPKLKAVLTTNIDRFLERAFQGEWRMIDRPAGDVAMDRCFILKLHGTLRAWDTWVFSRDQYDRAIFGSPLLQDAFGALYRTHSILFVGFGLADDNIDQTLARVRALSGGQPPMHFALLPKGVPPFRRRLLEESGVRLIVYENQAGDHAEVAQVLLGLEPGAAPPPHAAAPPPDVAAPPRAAPRAAQPSSPTLPSSPVAPHAPGATTAAPRPVRVFFSYASRDEELLARLEAHMTPLRREGLIAPWHSGEIGAGEDTARAIGEQLEAADLVLLLVSASYLASEQGDAQVARAMERRAAGQAVVVPILLRPCDWETTRFAELQAVPRDKKPVTRWPDEDEALLQVVREIRAVVTKLRPSLR
ncbi:putative membrane protein [Sorangium cellulosum So ce56]|uniref:Membrane protein n=1 Tax=Sorangium cellulosum (strain So ce56) TaxID=448385 RepID=A9G4K5_SORC5|nr:SIR2 family protein [Sorangium cellulosum]CAN98913.1 putative membrane protein [Sorangium cellulosum So ce56]